VSSVPWPAVERDELGVDVVDESTLGSTAYLEALSRACA